MMTAVQLVKIPNAVYCESNEGEKDSVGTGINGDCSNEAHILSEVQNTEKCESLLSFDRDYNKGEDEEESTPIQDYVMQEVTIPHAAVSSIKRRDNDAKVADAFTGKDTLECESFNYFKDESVKNCGDENSSTTSNQVASQTHSPPNSDDNVLVTRTRDGMPISRQDSKPCNKPSFKTPVCSIDDSLQWQTVRLPLQEKKTAISPDDSWIRLAIPYLPLWVAFICLILNIVVPGLGTILSGLCVICCGKSRVPSKYDQGLAILVCVNTWVGVAQLFTITFLLVGWFWSLAWGIKMVVLAIEYKKDSTQKTPELRKMATRCNR